MTPKTSSTSTGRATGARDSPRHVVADLRGRLGIGLSVAPFASIVEHAKKLSWTRDPFDRMIVATALADSVPLLTRDGTILEHCERALWAGKGGPPRGDIARGKVARKRPARRKMR